MTLSNQSHFPGFFLPSYRILQIIKDGFSNFCLSSYAVTKSQKMTCRGLANSGSLQAGIQQAPVSYLTASPKHGGRLTGAWPIPAYDKPELSRPRKAIFRDLVMPESHLVNLKNDLI
jgi:hypothetical protein